MTGSNTLLGVPTPLIADISMLNSFPASPPPDVAIMRDGGSANTSMSTVVMDDGA
jgi:hypothetical protein